MSYIDLHKLFCELEKIPQRIYGSGCVQDTTTSLQRLQNKVVAPSLQLLKAYKCGSIDMTTYKEQYISQLEQAASLGKLSGFVEVLKHNRTDVVLLCYEKNPKECHRLILAEFLSDRYGLIIKEL